MGLTSSPPRAAASSASPAAGASAAGDAVVVVTVPFGAGVEVLDLKISDVALTAFTELVSWPRSTRKQQVTAMIKEKDKGIEFR